ncbi:hypothetical protein L484_022292 [Morus notabilis]|uniref:Transmembrane protein n=1 Tax=Morus notabilis TaxID=981085 RepID=W9S6B5_9ROSA|nr:uncharacterized protein LOC21405111 [Morus notabilis]EXC28056.1 hypothetical protein L484_022292 [Morus notabilis]
MAFAPETPDRNSTKRTTAGLVASVLAFAYMFSKHASRVSKKLKPTPATPNKPSWKTAPPSPAPTRKPKKLLATISNKAITLVNRKKKADHDEIMEDDQEEWGHGGVWQRSILMGDKCQPLDFSGVIYYDSNGKQLSELPLRSPRASPLPGYLDRAKH